MSVPELRALLIDAPVGRHFAQIHSDSATLIDSVGLFTVTGLHRGNGMVVVVTPEHRDLLIRHLWYYDIDAEQAQGTGQMVMLDADATLMRFMRAGMPDWTLFRRQLCGELDGLQRAGYTTTRAYGEMVDVLWQRGQREAAYRLETYWNDLGRLYPFSLFCCYTGADGESAHQLVCDAARSHSHVFTAGTGHDPADGARDVFGAAGAPQPELLPRHRTIRED